MPRGMRARPPLRLLVMDPLAAPLACPCVEGYAQRDYARLASFLSERLSRPVDLAFSESLSRAAAMPDFIIGKWPVVVHDATAARLAVRPIAHLTGRDGSTAFRGLFAVRAADPARSIADLAGRSILFGPPEAAERHSAALAALDEHGVAVPRTIETRPACSTAAIEVAEGQADAAVISSYALALLEGCGSIEKGSLRVLGATRPIPFIAAFATESLGTREGQAVAQALLTLREYPPLLAAMESKIGFVPVKDAPVEEWPDWRGPRRDGFSPFVPSVLPPRKQVIWYQPLTGPALAGVTATARHVLVADKSPDGKDDVFRCFDAETGAPLWTVSYAAAGELDFTNSPRAQPVACGGLAYLLGAFGHLHCVSLATGEIVWKRRLAADFAAEPPRWGYAAAPLVVDDLLIVNPGGPTASLVALNRFNGRVMWRCPGRPAAYASFILATLGGTRQIVGYDATTLGGWEPRTGQRLWELKPEFDGDYNVPTPIAIGGKLLVATENNGTRLYAFGEGGRIVPEAIAQNPDLAPDTSSPVVLDGTVIGCARKLACLDLADGLKTLWAAEDARAFGDYASLIAGKGHLLVASSFGELLVLRADRARYSLAARLPVFNDRTETWSHPALVENRLYLRGQSALLCLDLGDKRPAMAVQGAPP